MRLYFDTSVLGALADRDDERRLRMTRGLFDAVVRGHAVNLRLGHPLVEIVSPEEVTTP
jgi:hypothetical protein